MDRNPETRTDRRAKDFWDKLDVVFKVLASLIVAMIGILGSYYLQSKQESDARIKLYTELMATREKADSDLRKEMFNTIINDFLAPRSDKLKDKVLELEILTYNFHDVIDLGPLFKELQLTIANTNEPQKGAWEKRLQKAAEEVIDKQLAGLKDAGVVLKPDVFFDDLAKSPRGITVLDGQFALPGQGEPDNTNPSRKFLVEVLYADKKTRELRIRMAVSAPHQPGVIEEDITFWVGLSDFPLIDNTRLSDGERVALVLRKWADDRAELAWAYFPGSRAGLKDKMYYDEVVDLLHGEHRSAR